VLILNQDVHLAQKPSRPPARCRFSVCVGPAPSGFVTAGDFRDCLLQVFEHGRAPARLSVHCIAFRHKGLGAGRILVVSCGKRYHETLDAEGNGPVFVYDRVRVHETGYKGTNQTLDSPPCGGVGKNAAVKSFLIQETSPPVRHPLARGPAGQAKL